MLLNKLKIKYMYLGTILVLFITAFINKAVAFEAVILSTKKLNLDKDTAIEAKVKTSNAKGKIKGIVNIDAQDDKQYYISISWNKFIDHTSNSIKDLDSQQFRSSFVSKSLYIKINQTIEVTGDLNNIITQNNSSQQTNTYTTDSSKEKHTSSQNMTMPSISALGDIKNDLPKQETPALPKIEKSSLNCEPVYNFAEGTATIFYEDYFIKPNGDKVVKKACYPSNEIVKIQYEECDMLHDFPQKQSWKTRRAYIETKEGRREVHASQVYGNAIPHKFDERNCPPKTMGNEVIVYAKRYITIPTSNQTIYLTDCEPLHNEKLRVDLRGCPISLYNIFKENKMVYPSGRRYIESSGKRVYIDNNCTPQIDFGSTFLTKHIYWKHIDNHKKSEDIWEYFFDFSEYEGGFKAKIPNLDYVHKTVDHKEISQRTQKFGHCGSWWQQKVLRRTYVTLERPDGSRYEVEIRCWCE